MRPADLSRLTGFNDSSISRYLNDRDPSLEFIMAVATALHLNAHWLLFGAGPKGEGEIDLEAIPFDQLQEAAHRQRMMLDRNFQEVVERMRALGAKVEGDTITLRGPLSILAETGLLRRASDTPSPKYRVAKTVEPGFKIVDAEQLPAEWRGNYLPLIGRIAAGKGVDTSEADSYPAGLAAHYVEMADSPRDGFAVSVEGDSMEPDFKHGDLVVSDGATRGRSGRVCIVLETTRSGDRLARVKRLVVRGKTAVLESANPAYQPIEVDAATIQAYAVWRHLAIRIER